MEHIGKGMLAGLVATLVLSALMIMKGMMGLMPQLDVIGMLSGMMQTSQTMGWLAHFVIGTVLYGVAIALLARPLPGGSTLAGIIVGVGGWLIMMIAVMPMAGQGLFGMNLGMVAPVMTLLLHVIFGAVLGWTYGKLILRDVDMHEQRPDGLHSPR